MNIFEKYITQINESVIDIERDSLDPTVFQFFEDGRLPILKDGIKAQILKDVVSIHSIIPVVDYFIIGSILTPQYNETSDIDVNVQVDAAYVDSLGTAKVLQIVKKLNGKYAVGTTHPINYYIITNEYNLDKTDAAYDVVNEKWLKTPIKIEPDIYKYANKFAETVKYIDIATGKLHRSLIDFEELKNIKTGKLKQLHRYIKRKVEEIEENVKDLVVMYKDIHILRKLAYTRFLTPQEIKEYGSMNRLPENIIYKLLQKYYYIDFMLQLKNLVDEKESNDIEFKDVEKVERIMRNAWRVK